MFPPGLPLRASHRLQDRDGTVAASAVRSRWTAQRRRPSRWPIVSSPSAVRRVVPHWQRLLEKKFFLSSTKVYSDEREAWRQPTFVKVGCISCKIVGAGRGGGRTSPTKVLNAESDDTGNAVKGGNVFQPFKVGDDDCDRPSVVEKERIHS